MNVKKFKELSPVDKEIEFSVEGCRRFFMGMAFGILLMTLISVLIVHWFGK